MTNYAVSNICGKMLYVTRTRGVIIHLILIIVDEIHTYDFVNLL